MLNVKAAGGGSVLSPEESRGTQQNHDMFLAHGEIYITFCTARRDLIQMLGTHRAISGGIWIGMVLHSRAE